MRHKILLAALLMLSILSFAQQGINYKALIKDDLGNVLANAANINVQFTIYEGAALTNPVYAETHSNVSTDANGIVILNIGNGTTTDVFTNIAWGNDEHWLNVQIDIGAGLVDVSTEQFMAVPYALNAANISGLERITENSNTGWRLLEADPNNYGNTGQWAVDLSSQQTASTNKGAIDFASFASGYQTTASGAYSVAMGNNTIASGFASTIFGQFNVENPSTIFAVGNGSPDFGDGEQRRNALTLTSSIDFIIGNSQIDDDMSTQNDDVKFFFSGNMGAFRAGKVSNETGDEWNVNNIGFYSTAFGVGTLAFGNSSFASGNNTIASGYSSTAMGNGTIASSSSTMAVGSYNIDDSDAQFMVGNGTDTNSRSSAFVVKKDGIILALGLDLSQITNDKALVTKEYTDQNYLPISNAPTGLEQLTESENSIENTGWRLSNRIPSYYGTIGDNAVDLSISGLASNTGATGEYTFASGQNTEASGDGATAMGAYTVASSNDATAFGYFTTASGGRSTAMGVSTNATGFASTAMGNVSEARGNHSTAMGLNTLAVGSNSVAIGNNTVASASNSLALGIYNSEDPNALLMVGNGSVNGSNTAFKILNNGDAVFDGEIQNIATGNSNLIPIAYGTVESTGNVRSGTGNFTASISAGVLSISVNGQTMTVDNSSCIITPYSTAFRTSSLIMSGGDIQVRIFDGSGNLNPTTFQFTIYKL